MNTIPRHRSLTDTGGSVLRVAGPAALLVYASVAITAGGAAHALDVVSEPSDAPQPAVVVIEPEMVRVPPAGFALAFEMGSARGGEDEQPVHPVTFKRPFAIGKYEVSFDEYAVFAQQTGAPMPSDEDWGSGRRPVINVSWDDARDYARWLSSVTGRTYRLPTEAEWEFASRAGTREAYWWGNAVGEGLANCYGCGGPWDGERTAPVGSFESNPWGLHDTLGNVWEWTADCWHENYQAAPGDGSVWLEESGGDCARHVVRGGAWFNMPSNVRSALRFGADDVYAFPFLGFRLAEDL
jgi:formylglycine-generating enzyme required for sulfatase activity